MNRAVEELSLDNEQKEHVIKLFNLGWNIGDIRTEVYSHIYNSEPTVRFRIYRSNTLHLKDKEKQKTINQVILQALGFSEWDDYDKERAKIIQKIRYEPEFRKVKKFVNERDGKICQVTGGTENLHIHHIDRNKKNNELWNLLTIDRRVHKSIEHSIWNRQEAVSIADEQWYIIEDTLRYVECLGERGYPECCIKAHVLLPGFFYTPYEPEKEEELEKIENPVRSFSNLRQLDEFIELGKKRQSNVVNQALEWQRLG
ncbi:MAG: HNH endonuclease signature motif containing protein, partial [Candidatus Thorarchaeota archaeon]